MIDVFILNYNGARYIERTLESIFRQMHALDRIILSDNGSTDQSLKVASKYIDRGLEIRRRKPGTGDLFSHANLCLSEAQSPYVAIFHNDDLYEPEILARQVRFLAEHPELGGVVTAGQAIDENDRILWPIVAPEQITSTVMHGPQTYRWIMRHGSSFLICPSALFRRSTLEKLGGFRPEFPNSADLEMFLRLMFHGGGLGYIQEPLIRYRISTGQASARYSRQRTSLSDFFQVMDLYHDLARPSTEDSQAYDALKKLDLLQVGLNRLQSNGDWSLLIEQIRWWREDKNRKNLKNLGGVDRLKVRILVAMSPLLRSFCGSKLAAFLNRQLDPRSGFLLKQALSWKRRSM
jgi:glycosyltransferase involved in cell wall biosynthesis